jgi:hypothetical protein
VLYLKANGMNARKIRSNLVATLGTKVLGYSTVAPCLREVQLDPFSETAVDLTEDVEVDEIDEAILSVLEVQPFGSVHDTARLIHLAYSTVHCPLSIVHCPLASHMFTGLSGPPSSLNPACLDGRPKASPSLKLGTALGYPSGAARKFLAGPWDARRVLVLFTH